MHASTLHEIRAVLPQGRTLFHYFDTRYAFDLLRWHVGDDASSVAALKRSPYASLLAKPAVKDWLARRGNGVIHPHDFGDCWARRPLTFSLSLGQWGSPAGPSWRREWFQTSRSGYNLVLQLNFSNTHDAVHRRLIGPILQSPFVRHGHPNNRDGRATLAWARIDLDFKTGEALIEEIQSDWIAVAQRRLNVALRRVERGSLGWDDRLYPRTWPELRATPRSLRRYVDGALGPYRRRWPDFMLTAALWFIREELGLRTVYYHTWQSGCLLKGFGNGRFGPPRSLYTSLPRQFCFRRVARVPQFLEKAKMPVLQRRRTPVPPFFRLDL